MQKKILVEKLTEGDWLVENVYKSNRLICKAKNIGLEKKDIINLKKNKIKYVLIKQGMPFVPAFLFGFIFTILFRDGFFYLFLS